MHVFGGLQSSRWVQLGVQLGGLSVSILRPVGPMFGSCSPDPPRALQESPKSPQTPQLGAKMARTWRQDGLQDLQLGAKMGVKSVNLEPLGDLKPSKVMKNQWFLNIFAFEINLISIGLMTSSSANIDR